MAYTTIDDPEAHFQVLLYTGNKTARALTFDGDTDMQPDLVWTKSRDAAYNHVINDAVRGVGETIYPNVSTAEEANSEGVTAFSSDGYSIGDSDYWNKASDKYVAWSWKGANGTASNTSGSLTTTVSANTTAGFSIVTYTLGSGTGSSTQGHGLGAKPDVIIWKSLANAYDWRSYWNTPSMLAGNSIIFNDTNALYDNDRPWNDTEPTSTLFTHGNNSWNGAGDGVAYCWTSIQGYSKIGEYTGNGNADGPFAYLGFRPAWLMIKNATAAGGSWHIYNNKVQGYNVENHFVEADGTTVEADDDNLDLLSNGFKIQRHTGHLNTYGETYIYMAFAEAPFVNSNGVPCNAR